MCPVAMLSSTIPLRNQSLIWTSLSTSHGFNSILRSGRSPENNHIPPSRKSSFVEQLGFTGSVDSTAFLCIPEAPRFRCDICGGESRIMAYCLELCHQGGYRVAEILNTEVMDNSTLSLTQCCIVNFRLPLKVASRNGKIVSDGTGEENIPIMTYFIMSTLASKYRTFIAILSTEAHDRHDYWNRYISKSQTSSRVLMC